MNESPAESAGNIERVVAEFVDAVTRADLPRRELDRRLDDVGQLGAREISATTLIAARIVDHTLQPADSPVGEQLARLRDVIEGRRGRRQRKRVHHIVSEMQEARARLDETIARLMQERVALGSVTNDLRRYLRLTERLDEECSGRAASPEVLDAVRGRHDVIAQHLRVAEQADAALRVMVSNDQALVRAIGVATTTSVAALSSSIAVADALAGLDELQRSNVLAVGNLEASIAAVSGRRAHDER
jgi:uncharacterized protein YaaN involved in tellurite resistance